MEQFSDILLTLNIIEDHFLGCPCLSVCPLCFSVGVGNPHDCGVIVAQQWKEMPVLERIVAYH
jgi:hypothetical protein